MENSFLYSYVIPLIACIVGFSIVYTFYYIITESLKNSNQLSNRKERGQKSLIKYIQEPTGPLSCNAINYIERDCDKILKSIDEERSEAYTINGGFQTGKTSLIRRYINKAKEKGWGVIDVDFKIIISKIGDIRDEKSSLEKILYLSIIETALESLRGYPLESDEVNKLKKELDKSKSSSDWALKELTKIHLNLKKHYNHDYCVICFDGIDHIYDAVKRIFNKINNQDKENKIDKIDKIDTLIFFFNNIRRKMSADFDKVKGLLCSIGPWSEDAAIRSQYKSQSTQMKTDFFNNEEILRLKEIFVTEDKNYKNIDDEKLKELNEYFNGSPYLMHNIVIEMCKNNAQVEDIKQAAKNLSEPYDVYWNRVKRVIKLINTDKKKSMDEFINQKDHDNNTKGLLATYGIHTQDFLITPFIKDMLEKEKKEATDAKQS